jgi:hypothetical protein
MFWLFVVALWTAMLLSPVVLLYVFLPAGRDCPRCTRETLSIRSRALRPVRRALSLRWCMECGWQGIARHGGRTRVPAPVETVAEPTQEQEQDSEAWRNNSAG